MAATQKYEGVTIPKDGGFRCYVIETRTGRLVGDDGALWTSRETARKRADELAAMMEAGTIKPNLPERLA